MRRSFSILRLILPNFGEALFIIIFLSVVVSGQKMLNIDGDLPRHLLMGKIVLETGTPPTQEIFSYVYEGKPYVPHEWLADVIFYFSYVFLKLNGVILVSSLLIASTFLYIYSYQSQLFLTFLLVILGATVTSIHWITRPHLFTMLFLAIWLILVDRAGRDMRINLWAFPLLMLLWSNIHAEFIAGFLILLAHIAGWFYQLLRAKSTVVTKTGIRLILLLAFSFLASLINPSGLLAWDIVFGYINNQYLLSHIAETQPPNFSQLEYLPLLILLILSVTIMIVKRNKISPANFLLLAGFGAMSLLSARNVHLFGVVAPFVLSRELTDPKCQLLGIAEKAIQRIDLQLKGKPWPVITTILVSSLLITGPLRNYNRFEPSVFPVNAVKWLENNPQSGRMFNDFNWGGYILFHLWPKHKVFIESQTDVNGEVTQKYETVIALEDGWQEILNGYEIKWAIVPINSPLSQALSQIQNWETIYQDGTAIILRSR